MRLNSLSELSVAYPDFATQLRQKMVNANPTPERLLISPERAEIMLQWNDRNRPISQHTIRRYQAAMSAGQWTYTGEAIIFSKDHLIDGQHRLMACVKSGKPFDALVVFGAPDDAFAFIDVGKTRTAGDIFGIHGVTNAKAAAAAIAWVIGYENGYLDVHSNQPLPKFTTHAELYAGLENRPTFQDSIAIGRLFGRLKLSQPAIVTGMHYICAQKSRDDADAFFRNVAEGIGFTGRDDPAYRMNKVLIDSATTRRKLGRTETAALFIKAWNAYRRHRPITKLSFAIGEAFPKAI